MYHHHKRWDGTGYPDGRADWLVIVAADCPIATADTIRGASLVPTVLNERRDKAATSLLTTSLCATALLLFCVARFRLDQSVDHRGAPG